MTSKVTNYNGHPILNLEQETQYGYTTTISFGIAKAKLILEHLNEIKDFLENYDENFFKYNSDEI